MMRKAGSAMKKIVFSLAFILLALAPAAGCTAKDGPFTVTAEISGLAEGGVTILADDPETAGFTSAFVAVPEAVAAGFNFKTGQKVEITLKHTAGGSGAEDLEAVAVKLVENAENVTVPYQTITPEQAKGLIDAGGVVILDVRQPDEYAAGHIRGAVLLPVGEIEAQAATVLPDKNTKILVYCRSGNRSAVAAAALQTLGYTDVNDFGGIIDWPYDDYVVK